MRIVIVGAGTSGLFAALVLARTGHDVTVIEKDPQPSPIDAASVAHWSRPGTPQAHLPHGFMARGRALVAAHAPDVLGALFEAGAVDFELAPFVPGGERMPGDDEMRIVFCRRPLFESVLWRAVEREHRVELRYATTVSALGRGGVVTDHGELRADLIIDAGGRRSPIAKWLGAPEPLVEPCGLVYYSTYFRLRPGVGLPRGPWLWGPRAELPFAIAIVHLADRGIYSITFGVPSFDAELKVLRDRRAFAAACALLPAFAPWADGARAEPITEVLAMGGLQNVLREQPHGSGVIAIGDALCHTNAAYGWGIALGMEHAVALGEILQDSPSVEDATRAYHTRVGPETRARWEQSVQQDRARIGAWRGEPPHEHDHRAAVLRALAPAIMLDPFVFRAVMRSSLLLDGADALLDPELMARARDAIARSPQAVPLPVPTRDMLLAAVRSG
jgi:2-polyprenyl-6-methoxyphenol hydroxylase-like FAD-dependent oxidoreductase